ncbi:MAG: glycosyltransferase family 2 protein [Nitrosomonadales bacterium]|nr:glycosyltransferase family 2 protein [Nitrosomonadales bacterium]
MNNNLFPSVPTVSIGLFIYNAEKTLRAAIDSILDQSFKDFELVISDNASTDDTEKICREYAQKDSRIRYIRQQTNQGASRNLQIVFDEARGEYFMWAAHDDIRSLDFLELNLKFLQSHPDYVASTSPVMSEGNAPDPIGMADISLDQETGEERFLACLVTWRACGRFYSLMRRQPIETCKALRSEGYVGSDTTLILELAMKGKFKRLEQGYVVLGRGGISGSGNLFRAYRKSIRHWLFPMYELGADVWAQSASFSLRSRIWIAQMIATMNLMTFLHQFKLEIVWWIKRKRAKLGLDRQGR